MGKSVLSDVGKYKNKIVHELITSKDICDLLIIDKDDYTINDQKELMYTQIFPYLYTDKEQEEVLPYIGVETYCETTQRQSSTIKNVKIVIWAYSHKECMNCKKKGLEGTRVDKLAEVIDRIINDKFDYGIGKPVLRSNPSFVPNAKYYGKELIYYIPDFKYKE